VSTTLVSVGPPCGAAEAASGSAPPGFVGAALGGFSDFAADPSARATTRTQNAPIITTSAKYK
jgi:hypothetical protein